MNMDELKQKCMIVKIGSSTITGNGNTLDETLMSGIASQVSKLFKKGWKIVIVSSGAVALGKPRMKICDNDEILCKQKAAARGQPLLMAGWQQALSPFGLEADQLLFNKKNFEAHMRVLNAINDGIVIANGDDTGNEPGVEKKIIYEDNDDLAADIAVELKADILVYLTDVDGILDLNGVTINQITPGADLIKRGVRFNGKNDKGTGGIQSKHKFASIAASKGICAIIAKGKDINVLLRAARNEDVGTVYNVKKSTLPSFNKGGKFNVK